MKYSAPFTYHHPLANFAIFKLFYYNNSRQITPLEPQKEIEIERESEREAAELFLIFVKVITEIPGYYAIVMTGYSKIFLDYLGYLQVRRPTDVLN